MTPKKYDASHRVYISGLNFPEGSSFTDARKALSEFCAAQGHVGRTRINFKKFGWRLGISFRHSRSCVWALRRQSAVVAFTVSVDIDAAIAALNGVSFQGATIAAQRPMPMK